MDKKMVPEVRFKGFTDTWELRKLKSVSDRVTRKNTNNQSTLPLTISAQYGLIDQKRFFNKQIASKKIDGYYLIYNGEFAYNKSYSNDFPLGVIKRLNNYSKGILSTLYIIFKPNNIESDFLASYYEANYWHRGVSKIATEGARNHGLLNISSNDFFNTEIKFPSNNREQLNIGKIISFIDKSITLQQRQLDLYKKLKKGLLQKLFPKDGEKVPKVRFADFHDNWEQDKFLNRIDSIVDFRGKTPKKLGMNWSKKGYLALSALNVKNGYIEKDIEAHYGNEKLYKEWMGERELRKGQVLFTTEAPMGNVAQVPDDDKYILSQRTIAFNVNKNKITNDFLAILLNSPMVFNDLYSLSSGGTAKGVSQKSLQSLKVTMPSDLEEQIKISLFFKHLEKLLTLKQDEINESKALKKYLLQKLFI